MTDDLEIVTQPTPTDAPYVDPDEIHDEGAGPDVKNDEVPEADTEPNDGDGEPAAATEPE